MKIALLGYGKMGRMIEELALESGHVITARLSATPANIAELNGAEVAIEFSVPESAVPNIMFCATHKIPVVVGTTGWYEHFGRVTEAIETNKSALFYATNYSLGVNIMFFVNKKLAAIMGKQARYQVKIEEVHHTHKLDSPSGTSISIAQQIISNSERWTQWALQENTDPNDGTTIPITAERRDPVPGIHAVTYSSDIDEIKLYHSAFNRKGFAQGAIIAAEWVKNKQGIFTMEDMLNF